MTEKVWLAADPKPLAEWLQTDSESEQHGLSRKYRLLNCACCRHLAPWFGDDRLTDCVVRAERFADGALTERTFGKWGESALTISRRKSAHPGPHLRACEAVCGLFSYRFVTYPTQWHAWRALCSDRAIFGESFAAESEPTLRDLIRDIFGNPFRPVSFDPAWRTDTAVSLAKGMYGSRDFGAMPILADSLQDAGCDSDDILNHSRGPGSHVRGCGVVDLVLGKE